jgi:hypothetical protein
MSFQRRIERFLYSRKNIAGALLAVAGVGLFVLGITGGWVGLGVIGLLYAAGYLVVPSERGLRLTLSNSQDSRDIRDGLNRLMTSIRYRVADDVYNRVGSIAHAILQTLPQDGGSIDATDPNVNLIRQTALAYLPQALDAYLAIPRIYAERRPISHGKTAHDVLLDQLNIMDAKMREVAEDIALKDTDRLLANVRFLQERFADSSLELDAARVPAPVSGDGPRIV